MSEVKTHKPVKYFYAITYHPLFTTVENIVSALKTEVDTIDNRSELFDFDAFTNYYQKEMGKGLKKFFVSFKTLRHIERLPDFKIQSNRLEQNYIQNGNRQVNLDPGYITEAKMALASTKDYQHRLYLKDNIFGDVHYYYREGSYRFNNWTYPDYQSPNTLAFFNDLRKFYRKQLKRIDMEKICC
jgi:hypothetical protein